MYDAFIDRSFDIKLKELEVPKKHFTLHPELLPFVGAHYKDYRVVLIGESHYVNFRDVFKNWYDESAYEMWTNASGRLSPEDFVSWFNTREIVNNFLCGKRTRAHHIFQYPADIIQKQFPNCCPADSSAFCLVAFFNYFQRPSTIPGGTFNVMDTKDVNEYDYAMKIADGIFKVLEPRKIIFLSKKAFEAYCSAHGKDETWMADKHIYYVNHPDSAAWNNENGKTRFISLIKETEPPECEKVTDCTVLELFAERLYRALKDCGYSKATLCDSGADSYKCFYSDNEEERKNKEYKIISLGEDCAVFVDHRVFIRYGKGKWSYLPDGGTDSKATESPNFRKPKESNKPFSLPCDDASLTELVEKCVDRINKIVTKEGID